MQKEYDKARRFGRWDKKRECYVNHKGDPVLDSSKVVYNDVLAVIPLSSEYYSKIEADKDYLKKLDRIIRDVMKVSLKKRDEERMKNSVEKLVDELKKIAEEGSDEQKYEEVKKEEGTGEEKQEKVEEKLEKQVSEVVAVEQQEKEEDQKQTAKEAEVPTIEVITKPESSDILDKNVEQFLEKENEIFKQKCSAMTEKCVQKENVVHEMKKEYESIKLAYYITKESYEAVKSQMKLVQSRLSQCSETSQTLKQQFEIKQQVVNSYIEEVVELKRKMADLEQDNNNLHSYHTSSYVLERIFNIKPDDKDSERNKKGIGSEYH
ncbi:gelsolin-related protein of 125 kDa-like [Helianthus annuus]|uniref:gelsolin-related protein of 125 kDa-like n=1 Tax=Helianthus annuus TaxID=4232 RepID=UPI000B900CC3|nr:gelsolin-related protein of 125 kDa-like [Helianthus annuus]